MTRWPSGSTGAGRSPRGARAALSRRRPSRSPAPSACRSASHERERASRGSRQTGGGGGAPMWRLTDEQRALREEIRGVVREEIRPRVRTMEENCEYPRDLYELMAERRLLGLGFPERYGGRCKSEASWCAYVEELAKVSGAVSLMAAYVKLVSPPLLLAGGGGEAQRGGPRPPAGGVL